MPTVELTFETFCFEKRQI